MGAEKLFDSVVMGAEKLFDSVVMGAVPVYWGCRRAADMLDPGAWPFSLRPRRARQPDPPLQAGREGAERSTGRRGPCRLQSVEAVSRRRESQVTHASVSRRPEACLATIARRGSQLSHAAPLHQPGGRRRAAVAGTRWRHQLQVPLQVPVSRFARFAVWLVMDKRALRRAAPALEVRVAKRHLKLVSLRLLWASERHGVTA